MADASCQRTVGGYDADAALAGKATIDRRVVTGAAIALRQDGRGYQHLDPLSQAAASAARTVAS